MSTLFTFTMGTTVSRWTSLQKDFTSGGNTYTAKPIQRGELVYERLNNKVTVKMPKDLFPASTLLNDIVTDTIEVELFNADGTPTPLFKGRVVDFQYDLSSGRVSVRCESFVQKKCDVLSRACINNCQWSLFEGFEYYSPSAETGTVSGNHSSSTTAITGSGTSFTGDYSAGDYISCDGKIYLISSITDNTNLVIDADYAPLSTTFSGVAHYSPFSIEECPVEKAATAVTISSPTFATSNGVASKKITGVVGDAVATGPDGIKDYLYGMAEFKDSGSTIIEKGFVVNVSDAGDIEFHRTVRQAADVTSIVLYKGCSKSHDTCREKFASHGWFGGYPAYGRPGVQTTMSFTEKRDQIPEVFGTQWISGSLLWDDPNPSRVYKHYSEGDDSSGYIGGVVLGLAKKLDRLIAVNSGDKRVSGGSSSSVAWDIPSFYPVPDAGTAFFQITSKTLEEYERFATGKNATGGAMAAAQAYGGALGYAANSSHFTKINDHDAVSILLKKGLFQKFTFYDGEHNVILDSYYNKYAENIASKDPGGASSKIDRMFFKQTAYVVLKEMMVPTRSTTRKTASNYWSLMHPVEKGPFLGSLSGTHGTRTRTSPWTSATITHEYYVENNTSFQNGVVEGLSFLCEHLPYIGSSHANDSIVGSDPDEWQLHPHPAPAQVIFNSTSTVTQYSSLYDLENIFEAGDYFIVGFNAISTGTGVKDQVYKVVSVASGGATMVVSPTPSFSSAHLVLGEVLKSCANPACVIYYVLNSIMGISASNIDTSSFTTARDTLATEKLGINDVLSSQIDTTSYINKILDFIHGEMIYKYSNGLITLSLKRKSDSVVRTYGDGTGVDYFTSKFSINSKQWEALYNKLFVKYELLDFKGQYAITNELVGDMLGQNRVKRISSPFKTIREAVQFFGTVQMLENSTLTYKVSFEVFIKEIFTYGLKPGDVISYKSDHYPVDLYKMRVDKISGISEERATVRVHAVTDVLQSDSILKLPKGRYLPDLSQGASGKTRLIPNFRDFKIPSLGSSEAMLCLTSGSVSGGRSTSVEIAAEDEYGKVSEIIKSQVTVYGELTAEYARGAFYDPDGFYIDVDKLFYIDDIVGVEDSEYVLNHLAMIVDPNVSDLTEDDVVAPPEIVSFKSLTAVSGASVGYQRYLLEGIVRNLALPSQYLDPSDKYSGWGSDSKLTGQYTRRVGSEVWLFLGLGEYANTLFNVSTYGYMGQYIQASYEHTPLNSVNRGITGSSELTWNKPGNFYEQDKDVVISFPSITPFPVGGVYAYRIYDGTNYYFVVYVSPANPGSGASYRDEARTPIDAIGTENINIKVINTDFNTGRVVSGSTIEITPSDNFKSEYDKTSLGTGSTNIGNYWKGYITDNQAYEFNGTDTQVNSMSTGFDLPVIFDSKTDYSGTSFGLGMDVSNMACVVIFAGTSIDDVDFEITQGRGVLSQRKTFTLDNSTTEVRI